MKTIRTRWTLGARLVMPRHAMKIRPKALRVGYTSLKTQWGQYHWSWLSLVYILPQAVAFERKLRSCRILWFDVDISKIVGHSLPFHSRHSLPFASTFVGKSLFCSLNLGDPKIERQHHPFCNVHWPWLATISDLTLRNFVQWRHQAKT